MRLYFFLIILFYSFLSFAQTPSFRHFSVNDGLPSSEIYQVMQDKKGYIWIATDCGVSRYDGYSFKNFSISQGLPDNCVFDITEDHKQRKWLRTISGKIAYIENDSVTTPSCYPVIKRWSGRGFIRSMFVDKGDTLWLSGSASRGVLKIAPPYTEADVRVIDIPCEDFFVKKFEGGMITGFQAASYEINKKAALNIFSANGSRQIPLSLYRYGQTRNLYYKADPAIGEVIGWDLQGVLIRKDGRRSSRDFRNMIIYSGFTRDNRIWFGMNLGGVMSFSPDSFNNPKPLQHYLIGKSVSSVLEDNEKGLWFSTLDDGLYYFKAESFRHFDVSPNFESNRINSLITKDDEVFGGLPNGKLVILKNGKVSEISLNRIGRPPTSIQSLCLVDSATLMAGAPGGFFVVDLKTKKAIRHWALLARSFYPSKTGGVWMGAAKEVFKVFPRAETPIREQINFNDRITCVFEDKAGILWVGTLTGLYTYENGKLQSIKTLEEKKVNAINQDPDGSVLVATSGYGLYRIKGNLIGQISTKDGLSSDLCRSIYIDKKGAIWVGTNAGICKLFRQSETESYLIRKYSFENGLSSNDVYDITGDNRNNIWLATNHGVDQFAGENTVVSSPPPLYLSSFRASGVELPLQNYYELPTESNTIEIGFTGISFKGQENLIYKYRLEGVDLSWSYTTHRVLRYPSLLPGQYKLQVYITNTNSNVISGPLDLSFTIQQPFYKSWWFAAGMFFGLPSIVGFSVVQAVRRSRAREKQEQLLKQRIAEMELKALKAQMKPHFIFNTLNAIQYFVIKNDNDSAEKYLNTFARLLRNVLEHSDLRVITLKNEIDTLHNYLQLEKLRYKDRLEYEFIVDVDPSSGILIPPMLIQPYVENAIVHGIGPLEKGGKITLRFSEKNGYLVVVVEDNGVGFKRTSMGHSVGHRSMGMKITRERLEILNVFYREKNVEVIITDLGSESGTTSGTRIELFIPSNS